MTNQTIRISILLVITLTMMLVGCGMAGDPILDILYSRDILPGTASTFSVGSEDLPFREGWFDSIHVKKDSIYVGKEKNPWENIESGGGGNMTAHDISGEYHLFPESPAGKFLSDNGTWQITEGSMVKHGNEYHSSVFALKTDIADDSNLSQAAQYIINNFPAVEADSHEHSNKNTLDLIQEAFTTALKSSYDWLVTNVTEAWKASIDSHISDTSNPHSVTANQVLPSQSGHTGEYLTTDGTATSWAEAGGAGGDTKVVYIAMMAHYTALEEITGANAAWQIAASTTYGQIAYWLDMGKLGTPSSAEFTVVYTNTATVGTNQIAITLNDTPQTAYAAVTPVPSSVATMANSAVYPQTIVQAITPSELGSSGVWLQFCLNLASKAVGPQIRSMALILYY